MELEFESILGCIVRPLSNQVKPTSRTPTLYFLVVSGKWKYYWLSFNLFYINTFVKLQESREQNGILGSLFSVF